MRISKARPAGISKDKVPLMKIWQGKHFDKIPCPINPFFFVKSSDFRDKISTSLSLAGVGAKPDIGSLSTDDTKMSMLMWYGDEQMRTASQVMRDGDIRTYQSDRNMIEQWMTYCEIEPMHLSDLRVACVDIEVDSRAGFPDVEDPKQRVYTICLSTPTHEKILISDDNERKMFEDFRDIQDEFDVIGGWNSEKFDFPYLRARAKYFGINIIKPHVSYLDAMKLYAASPFSGGKSKGLEDASRDQLDREIKQGFEGRNFSQEMYESFMHRRDIIKNYCWEDADAALELLLTPKMKMLNLAVTQCQIAHIEYESIMFPSKIIDSLVLGEAIKDTPIPVYENAKGSWKKGGEAPWFEGGSSYEGALVLEPIVGLHGPTGVFDYSGMYPRSMRTFGLTGAALARPEEYINPDPNIFIKAPDTEVLFNRKKPTPEKRVLEKLEREKLRYRELYQKAGEKDPRFEEYKGYSDSNKTILLTTYGVFGDEDSRFFSLPVAESITSFGRYLLNAAKEAAEAFGLQVNYGDTDSIFTEKPGATIDEFRELVPRAEKFINSYIAQKVQRDFNVPPNEHDIELKLDYFFRRLYIPAKKSYIGPRIYKGGEEKIYSKGFASNKYSTFPLYKTVEKEFFRILFNTADIKQAELEARRYLNSIQSRLTTGEYDEDLVMRNTLSMPLEEYGTSLPYVTAAKNLKARGLYRDGDVVKYVVVSQLGGKVRVEPVYDSIPRITPTGYLYYYDKVCKYAVDIFGSGLKKDIKGMFK
jgi:DNA polymerase, archaea type